MISKHFGISKTVYSFYYPEVENVVNDFLRNVNNDFHSRYYDSASNKQDKYHLTFLDKFKQWSKPVLDIDWSEFPHSYPTGGASEAIREQIVYLKTQGYEILYVLEGEYEGYEAIAKTMNFEIVKVPVNIFNDFSYSFDKEKKSIFFVSNPNSINGNTLPKLDEFMIYMDCEFPNIRFYVDIVYIGTLTTSDYTIMLKQPNIDGVFFSLSKSFGVYYHRVGGCFLKHENPLLYGNKWFKNLLSMQLGEKLMDSFDVHYLPSKYKNVKRKAIKNINAMCGNEVLLDETSECVILTTSTNRLLGDSLFQDLAREKNKKDVRICLTSQMEKLAREE